MDQTIIEEIKLKKEFTGLSDEFVESFLKKYLLREKIRLANLSGKQKKVIVKEIRAELRNFTGQFQFIKKKRKDLLEKGDIDSLLKSHSSTRERLDIYQDIKKIITSLKPKKILDLGCGLNPIALGNKDYFYIYADLNMDDLNIIESYFIKNKIKGEKIQYDLRNFNKEDFPKIDLCIIWKVLDVIEKRTHKLAKKILEDIDAIYILVSFATKKLSGRKMNSPSRKWFEKILSVLDLEYKKYEFESELFYLIKK